MLGSGLYSTADITLPGRALFSSGAEIPLKNIFLLSKGDVNSEIYQAMIDNKITSFNAEGTIITQSSWSEAENEFKNWLLKVGRVRFELTITAVSRRYPNQLDYRPIEVQN